ncbi:MAG: DUF1566 domain-containing protein [Paludibacter sp.]|nr:DUF1566 domain-containing protein [Paludibacter sp.]
MKSIQESKSLGVILFTFLLMGVSLFSGCTKDIGVDTTATLTYPIVDTYQGLTYDDLTQVSPPAEGESYYGQDAQYTGNNPSYTDNGDGTITDNVTSLIWAQDLCPSTRSWSDARYYCDTLTTGGYTDWRMPTVKELWSIRDFSMGWPWVNTDYFYLVGDGTEMGKHHSWTSNTYLVEDEYQNEQVIGDPHFIVNDWTGHIKAMSGNRFVRPVRGVETYGINDFVDNGDETITDNATGLMWSKNDSGEGFLWEGALAYAENATVAGYDDWRLPNAKELQSIADYSGAFPAMNTTYFNLTKLTNIKGQTDYPFYWSSTSNPIEGDNTEESGGTVYAWVLAAGYNTDMEGNDLHGAGSVVFVSKSEEYLTEYDMEIHHYNYVRLVRGGNVTKTPDGNPDCINSDRTVSFPDTNTTIGGGGGDTGGDTGGGATIDFTPGVTYLATLGITVTVAELTAIIGGPTAPTAAELVVNFAAKSIVITEAQAQTLLDTLKLA